MSDINLIKRIRLNLGLTQEEFSKELGVKPPTVYSYENGSRRPRIKTINELMRLAKKAKMKVKAEEFLN